MVKKIAVLIFFTIILLINTANVSAKDDIPSGGHCPDGETNRCRDKDHSCQLDTQAPLPLQYYYCRPDPVKKSFGSIEPPIPLQQFIGKDPTGAGGISRFLSNLVALFYSLAGIVLIFMLLWGAWDWMTSEGDKEKLDSARKKIINALVGIVLFAIAFALIQVLGQFTGFKFFVGQ
ncbi:hypothetical protein A3B42_00930 [Candidatus Daviesbacteria bacterium RIFCSPLOWO2_01_FULL_38_10]|nr:MAG: hypothetical protein US80_C0010G0003 [Candidatus Daviesbacteria bacterium GW2011_GWA2_38_17]OGE37131.1 MAG: hypothetical protein A3B42_00930 [Candidatus Daviesbacteria bacterium RIFCSPLOWO2_01_FULL_38_10]OGE45574.1 MAG: hypothetical protein A3E67_03260 [Candidatus Daviesbacteria bacterium RIFCSPHIGHO2_12_FULL_38_25]OGE73034.1 MAG: hypothetical protein A3H18_02215 [Candidatus Daviesbacteria bacterium RIFCSPLOWO2_12_FULL_38_10]